MTYIYSAITLALFALGANACANDEVATSAGSSSGSSTTTTTTTTSTTTPTTTETPTTADPPVVIDEDVCEAKACDYAEDCCENLDHPGSACPNGPYPDNWTCFSGDCVPGGCTDAADCILQEFKCLEVGGIKSCVVPCDEVACDASHMEGTYCIGVADDEVTHFCLEGPVP